MSRRSFALLGFATVAALSYADAHATSLISYSTRNSVGNPGATTSAQYEADWNALAVTPPTSGYGDETINDWTNISNGNGVSGQFGTNENNIAYHVNVSFIVPAGDSGLWTFHVGADYGFGGTVQIDGADVGTNTGNFYDANQAFSVAATLSPGVHTLDTYGFEDCCDGPTNATFEDPNSSSFRAVNSNNLIAAPEPTMAGVAAVALLGLAARRRHA